MAQPDDDKVIISFSPESEFDGSLGIIEFGPDFDDWYIDVSDAQFVNSNLYTFMLHMDPNQTQDVPEPGTLSIAALGLLGMGIVRRRSARKA